MTDKRKIYGIEITHIEQTTVYVKADSPEAAIEWVDFDVSWFDTEPVETKIEHTITLDDESETGGEKVHDSEENA